MGLIKCHPISQTPITRWCWRRRFGVSDHIEAKLHLSSLFHHSDPPHTTVLIPGMMAAFLFLWCSSLPASQGTGVNVGWEPGTGFQGDETGLFQPTNLRGCSSRVGPEWDEAREENWCMYSTFGPLSSVSFYVILHLQKHGIKIWCIWFLSLLALL